jgi:2-dehydro-3-deoxyphosphogluconate aldolase/(4S)-4-hydroxy-2-oxoglutarate aldolase
MNDPIETIRAAGVLPVVTIDDADLALPLTDALAGGGLHVVEVTLRTRGGLEAIASIAAESPTTCVGAGSVTTADQANDAAEAGAKFLISPGLDEGVVIAAREHRVPVIPGIATATELMRAIANHLHVVKFFPAETLGGRSTLRALSAVWPDVQFVPTGGITAHNAVAYLDDGHVLAVGGSWIAPRELIATRQWKAITELAAHAVKLAGRRQ